MEAIRLHEIVEKDGEILVTGLPCKKGQTVEMILLMIDLLRQYALPYPLLANSLSS